MADLILPQQLVKGDVLADDIYPQLQGRKVQKVTPRIDGRVHVLFADNTEHTFEDGEGLIYVQPS